MGRGRVKAGLLEFGRFQESKFGVGGISFEVSKSYLEHDEAVLSLRQWQHLDGRLPF